MSVKYVRNMLKIKLEIVKYCNIGKFQIVTKQKQRKKSVVFCCL